MAEAIVGPVLSKLQEVALKEGKALAGVGDEIDRLRERLMWLHALVYETDLRTRSEGNQLIRVLASQMREIAFEAEDAVDHFVLKVDLSRFGRHWHRAARLFFANFGTQIYVRYMLSQKIKAVNMRLEDIHDNNAKYSGNNNETTPAVTWRASRYIPPVRHNWDDMGSYESTEPNKTKKTELTELLLDMEIPAGQVIYVVGESGIGKRHLVKKVYEDEAINEKFTVRIWEKLPADSSNSSIADKIKGKLEAEWTKMEAEDYNSTYLVVVDCPMSRTADLGNIIVGKFTKGGKGSKIVLATTSSPPEENGGIVKLGYLDKTTSITLFNKGLGLGGHRESDYKTEMKKNFRETIEGPTNGLPLAVILLAKLLRTMAYSKWESASEYIRYNHQGDPLKTIVSMGIDDLPDDLKSCLLYMAGFPDRSTIDAGQLVRLWIAEGFLTQQHGVEPEEVGQRYLKELIFRGLVQLVDKKGGDVESVAIRDQVHPFFRWEAQRTGFMETYYGGSAAVPDSARRLALNSRNLPKPDKMKVLEKLRTLLSSHDNGQNHDAQGPQSFKEIFPQLLMHSTFLRVISLEGIDIGEELPREIRNMLHLQYLGIRCPTLTTLPNSIRKLKQLQIMDVRGTKVTTLPYSFWNMKSKPHVICDKDLGCPKGAEDRMLIMTPATSSSKHI
uniref:Uncharacterized protein n=1 Tax=Avena sativa TaxID=4498 RepID=A0ACD6APN5_AVESA